MITKKAHIQKVTKGKNAGQYKFILKARNGEVIAVSHPETYRMKIKCKQTLRRCFPDFEIVDKSI